MNCTCDAQLWSEPWFLEFTERQKLVYLQLTMQGPDAWTIAEILADEKLPEQVKFGAAAYRKTVKSIRPMLVAAGFKPGEETAIAKTNGHKANGLYTDEFEHWFRLYPRHVAKGEAAKAFQATLATLEKEQGNRGEALVWLMTATEEFASSPKGRSGQFCPYPATWLRARNFEDDPEQWQVSGNGPDLFCGLRQFSERD